MPYRDLIPSLNPFGFFIQIYPLQHIFLPVVSGDHRPGGAADSAESGERRVEPAELLPVQTAGRGLGREGGPAAAQPGSGPAEEGGGGPRDAPQQPETGRRCKQIAYLHSHTVIIMS